MYLYPDAVLLVFCKAPLPGQVKTRLIPVLSAEEALAAHLELSRRTLRMATAKRLCQVELWCSPTVEHPFFTEAAQHYAVSLRQQQGRDLGERMHNALSAALRHFSRAVLIGTDCPSLRPDHIEAAIKALDDAPNTVFAPAEDGGYVLVGLNRPQPEVFTDMAWGTPEVMEVTRGRLKALGEPHVELEMQWDVDTAADFERYRMLDS